MTRENEKIRRTIRRRLSMNDLQKRITEQGRNHPDSTGDSGESALRREASPCKRRAFQWPRGCTRNNSEKNGSFARAAD
jgi:hypothetical protein